MNKKAFTLIELLVVISIIALLLAILVPSLSRAKELAQRVVCKNNIKQQCLGVTLYANENDSWVPTEDTGSWLWDISFWSTIQISEYAGFDDNEVYFCPANKLKKAEDARFWQFSWCIANTGWGAPDMYNEVPLNNDEDELPIGAWNRRGTQKGEWRVMPVLYMFDKINDQGASILPEFWETGEKSKWISKLSDTKNAPSTIMIMDNIISESNGTNFFEIQGGWTWQYFREYDSTNHQSRQPIPNTNLPGPAGANIGYADGHVDWLNPGTWKAKEDFENISVRVKYGQWFWW